MKKALVLSRDLVILNIIEVESEDVLPLIAVGDLPKMMHDDIAPEGMVLQIGQDVSSMVLAAREKATDNTARSVVGRILAAIGIK